MASNARFHNKYHRRNHHTLPSAGYPDSGADPIASPQEPFLGDFHAVGALSATGNLTIGGNTLVYGNLSALGEFSVVDTIVTVTSALSVINDGTGPAFTVQQKGAQPIAIFFDDSDKIFNLKNGLRAEFFNSQATNTYALAEGQATLAQGNASHSEGISTQAFGQGSHAEGAASTATGDYSHAQGNATQAIGNASHAEGDSTVASGEDAHAEGNTTVASGLASHAEGTGTLASNSSTHAEGYYTSATGIYSHAQGYNTLASGTYSHAEGFDNFASGNYSHAEGGSNTASGIRSHAEGGFNWASGSRSHAEGSFTRASGNYSHTEGQSVSATSDASHAEGFQTTAAGSYSHAQGNNTIASGIASHAAGAYSNAIQENTTAIGVKANAAHRGAVVISTNTNQYNSSSFGDETFNVFASGGTYIFNKTTIGDPVSATSFVVTSGGLVGINVNDPSERLTVNGNISSNGTLFTTSITSRGIDIIHTPANDGTNPILKIGEYSTSSGNLGFSGIFMSYNESTNVFGISAEFDPAPGIPAMSIDRNGKVGIGTNNPAELLTVNGNLSAVATFTSALSVLKTDTGADAAITVLAGNASGDAASIFFGYDAGNGKNRGQIRYYNGGVEAMAFSTSTVEAMRIRAGGQVGLGTTQPAEKLTVSGNISSNGTLFTKQMTAYGLDLVHTPITDGTDAVLRIGESNYDSPNLGFSGAFMSYDELTNVFGISSVFADAQWGIPALAIDRNGNVGIGTTVPAEKLTVSGNISASGSLSATTMFTTGSGNVIIDRGNYRRNTDPTIIIGANSDQHLRFRAGGDTSNEIRMTILSSGEVGVGTSLAQTAAAKLTVIGNISASGNVLFNSATGRSLDLIHTPANDGTNPVLRMGEIELANTNAVSSFSGAFISYDENTNVFGISSIFAPAMGTPAMSIDRNGNVGFGTNTPDQKLHVLKGSAGAVTADTNSIAVFEGGGSNHITILTPNGNTGGVVFGSPTDNSGSYLSWNYDNNALKLATDKTGGFISLLTDDEAEAVRITSTGNVGISTTAPAERLTVNGNISANGTLSASGTGNNYFAGNVSIGTDTPTANANLTIVKSIAGGGGAVSIVAGNASGDAASINFGYAGNTSRGQIRYLNGSTDAMSFYTSSNEMMRIKAGGQVGIGTTNPAERLTVNGNISANGGISLKVPVTVGADYSVTTTDTSIICNGTGTINLTLQSASSYPGRILYVKTVAAQLVNSASGNVVPVGSTGAGTAILTNTAGKWAMLQSDGVNWVTMMAD